MLFRSRISWQEARDPTAYGTAYRACLNHIIQGTGADIVKQSMIKISNRLSSEHLQARMSAQIHDEIIVMAPMAEYVYVAKLMAEEMYYELQGIPLPASAEVKTTWSKLEEPLWKPAA